MKRQVVSIESSLFITKDYFQNYKSITSMYQYYKHKSLTKVFKNTKLDGLGRRRLRLFVVLGIMKDLQTYIQRYGSSMQPLSRVQKYIFV